LPKSRPLEREFFQICNL